MDSGVLALHLTASRAEVGRALDAVQAYAEELCLPEDLAFNVSLAVDETLANIVLHGYGEDGSSLIHLTAHVDAGVLVLEMTDHAPPFDPADIPLPQLEGPGSERRLGGLGVFLVRSVTHEVLYRREDERNHLVLRWNIPPCEARTGKLG